jgi:hypothetical protein
MRFTKTIASASVAAVLGLTGVSVAGAASTGTTPKSSAATSAPSAKKADHAAALRRKIRRQAGALVAKTIGIKRADLRKELVAGKTIAAIATEHGVQPQQVIDTLVAAANKKIDTAVTNGKLTAARAAKLKVRISTAIPKLVNEWHPKAKPAA